MQKRNISAIISVCVCAHVAIITSLLCSALYLALKGSWGLLTSPPYLESHGHHLILLF